MGGYELVRICDGYEYEMLEPRRGYWALSLSTTPRNVVLRTNPKQLFSYSATQPENRKAEIKNGDESQMGVRGRKTAPRDRMRATWWGSLVMPESEREYGLTDPGLGYTFASALALAQALNNPGRRQKQIALASASM